MAQESPTKVCTKCDMEKPEGDFHRRNNRPNGSARRSDCKKCCNIRVSAWQAAHRDRLKSYRLKGLYGITADQWQAMFDAQDGICANDCCGLPCTDTDHDHATGLVRQLLCGGCNKALGHVNDDVRRLIGLADYVDRHNGGQ